MVTFIILVNLASFQNVDQKIEVKNDKKWSETAQFGRVKIREWTTGPNYLWVTQSYQYLGETVFDWNVTKGAITDDDYSSRNQNLAKATMIPFYPPYVPWRCYTHSDRCSVICFSSKIITFVYHRFKGEVYMWQFISLIENLNCVHVTLKGKQTSIGWLVT